MFMTRLFAVVLTVSLCSPVLNVENIGIIVPWLGTTEIEGPTMGSSFMIAMKRDNYTKPFALLPLRCDNILSVINQVQTLHLF